MVKAASTAVLAAVVGLIGGLGGYTFFFAEGHSYFSNDPAACVNCHIMRDQFESWSHSSHRNWATCNDCHMPHGQPNGLYTKALNGFNHSLKFTTGDFPEPIVIKSRNQRIALTNCVNCHGTMVHEMGITAREVGVLNCVRCHGNVGHQGTR